MGADAPPLAAPPDGVPRFAAPEEAVRALRRALDHGRRLARPPDDLPPLDDVDPDRAAAIVASGLERGGGWLPPTQVEALLKCYGLPTAASRVATSARGAVRAAARLGGDVAVKALAPGLHRKAEAGAVRVGLSGPTAVERAARDVLDAAREHGFEPEGVLVQRMAPAGNELLAGVASDPSFGPLVVLAAGGATAELLGDVEARLAPVGPREADGMISGLRSFPLLDGFRGRPRADLAALRDALLRIGALADQHPAVAELDCDPLIAGPAGVTIVDARVRLEPPPRERPYAALSAPRNGQDTGAPRSPVEGEPLDARRHRRVLEQQPLEPALRLRVADRAVQRRELRAVAPVRGRAVRGVLGDPRRPAGEQPADVEDPHHEDLPEDAGGAGTSSASGRSRPVSRCASRRSAR